MRRFAGGPGDHPPGPREAGGFHVSSYHGPGEPATPRERKSSTGPRLSVPAGGPRLFASPVPGQYRGGADTLKLCRPCPSTVVTPYTMNESGRAPSFSGRWVKRVGTSGSPGGKAG